MTKHRKPETLLQVGIVDALRTAGYLVLRLQSGKAKVQGGWMQLCPEGTPDLLVVGRCFLEVKTKDGALTEEQEKMHRKIRQQGVPVHTVRTAREALEAVQGVANG